MRLRDMIKGVDYADLMERQMFCFGSDDSGDSGGGGNDEPQGTVFGVNGVSQTGSTAADKAIGYTDGAGGQGVNYNLAKAASDTQVRNARAVADSGGSNDDIRVALGGQPTIKAADTAAEYEAAAGIPVGQGVMAPAQQAAAIAQANTSPSGSLTINRIGIDGNVIGTETRNFGGAQPLSLAGELLDRNIRNGVPRYNSMYGSPVGTVQNPIFPDAQRDAAQRMTREAGEVYYDEVTGTYKAGRDPSLMDIAANQATADDGFGFMAATNTAAPLKLATDYTDEMLVDSGVAGVGKLPAAPVLTNGQYSIAGVPVTDELAQIAMDTRGSIIDALPSPQAGIGQNIMGFFTGQDPTEMAAKQYGEFLALDGAVINPETGNVTAPAGQGLLTLNNTLGNVTYSGMPDPNYSGAYSQLVNPTSQESENAPQVVNPVTNPMTGGSRCPEGYIFDEDLQACRMDTGSAMVAPTTPTNPAESGIYFRETALDQAPANVPQGFDFDAANRRFTESYGVRPDFYRKPMNLTGFRKL